MKDLSDNSGFYPVDQAVYIVEGQNQNCCYLVLVPYHLKNSRQQPIFLHPGFRKMVHFYPNC